MMDVTGSGKRDSIPKYEYYDFTQFVKFAVARRK